MVQRRSEPVQFRTGDAPQLGQQQVGVARVRETAVRVGEGLQEDWKARLFSNVAQTATQLGIAEFDARIAEEYLQGAAAAASGDTEADLQTSQLTADWTVAGFRDTTAKLKMADMQSRLARDMQTLREVPPEEFLKRVTADRAELMQNLPGMSREQRAAALGQIMLNDRAAITKHGEEHAKFIVEQKAQAHRVGFVTSMGQLQAARDNKQGKAYVEAVNATAGAVIGGLWMDPSIPADLKQSMTQEWIEEALAADHPGVFEYLRDTRVPGGGADGTLYSLLSDKTRSALGEKYRSVQQRLALQQNQALATSVGMYEAQRNSGEYALSFEEAVSVGTRMIEAKLWDGPNGKEYINWIEGHYRAAKKQNDKWAVGQAYLQGRPHELNRFGATEVEGRNAVRELTKEMPPPLAIQTWFQAGDNGMKTAYEEVGLLLRPALGQLLRPDGTMVQENVEALKALRLRLDKYREDGMESTIAAVKSGLGPEMAQRLDTLEHFMGVRNMDPQAAVAATLKFEQDWQSKAPQERAAIHARSAAADAEFVNSIEPMNYLNRAWSWVAGVGQSLVPGGASGEAEQLRRTVAPGGDPFWQSAPKQVLNEYALQTKAATLEELADVNNFNPLMSDADRHATATAAVLSRTIKTPRGALIMPKGVDPARFFKLNPGDGIALTPLLGDALAEAVQPQSEGGSMVYYFSQGKLHAQEYDRKGAVTGRSKIIEPEVVRDKAFELNRRKIDESAAIFGPGKLVKKDGLSVQFNGENSASVEPRLMLQFRENLVNSEGIKDVPYKDLSGKIVDGKPVMTVGVGVSSHNKRRFPRVGSDGKVSQREIERSFKGASDDAALAATRVLNQHRRTGDAWFLLSAEMAYQSGPGFGDFDSVKALYQNRDPAKAVALLRETPAWKHSGSERRKHYETLITQAMQR